MEKTTQKQVTSNMGFLSWLTLLFIGLKLTGNIDWSWWWVLSPTLIPIGILLAVLAVLLIVVVFAKIGEALTRKR